MKRLLIILLLLGLTVLIAYTRWVPTLDTIAIIFIVALTGYIGFLLYKLLTQTKSNNAFVNVIKWLLGYSILIGILGFNLILIEFRPNHIETVSFSNKTFHLYYNGWFGDDIYEVRTKTNVLPISTYIIERYIPRDTRKVPKITQKGDTIFFDGIKIYNLKTEKIIDEQLDNLLNNNY